MVRPTGEFGGCTGTLITDRLVLTAAHCIEEMGRRKVVGFYLGGGEPLRVPFAIGSGAVPASFGERHTIAQRAKHPRFRRPSPSFDVGLVLLDEPVSGVTPAALGRSAGVGKQCTVIGYGMHKEPSSGVTGGQRRRAQMLIHSQTAATLVAIDGGSAQIGPGDSGGPLLCGDRVAAVTSATRAAPEHWEEHMARIDGQVRTWIDRTMRALRGEP
jgi:V8-like Glu-specific endopeptidase